MRPQVKMRATGISIVCPAHPCPSAFRTKEAWHIWLLPCTWDVSVPSVSWPLRQEKAFKPCPAALSPVHGSVHSQ